MHIPLRQGRLSRADPSLQIDGADLVVDVRRVFAGGPWRIPLEQVAVVIPSQVGEISAVGQGFATDPDVLAVRTTLRGGNLQLLFRQPLVVPPLRLNGSNSPDEYWRFRHGRAVDGLRFEVADPAAAVAELQTAGAEEVDAPTQWLRRHRELTHDPARLAEAARRRRGRRIVNGLAELGFVFVFVDGIGAFEYHGAWFWALGGVGLALMVLPRSALRLTRRR